MASCLICLGVYINVNVTCLCKKKFTQKNSPTWFLSSVGTCGSAVCGFVFVVAMVLVYSASGRVSCPPYCFIVVRFAVEQLLLSV